MAKQNFQEGEIFTVSKLEKFMSVLHLSTTRIWWHSQFPNLSRRFAEDPEEGIFEESKGNLKDSLSPRFSLSQNLEIWQSILHYSMPQIWWCVHIFHFLILFFSHFSKWSAGININVQAVISMWFDAAISMVRTSSAAWHPFLQMAWGYEVYVVRSCTSFCGALCCTNPYLMLMWDRVSCFHDSFFMWCRIICVMYLMSWFTMLCF